MKDKELFDSDGYPTEMALFRVAKFDTVHGDIEEFLSLIQALWSYPDRFCRRGNTLYLSTGGWSGNESVIKAMRENIFFFIAHSKWQRGGHFWFDLKAYKKPKKKKKPKYYTQGKGTTYKEGTDPEVTCWHCKKTFLCDCMDAVCRLCGAPYSKDRCAEFGFTPKKGK